MANQLDLEEQEQLDQLKHFWSQYGNLITWLLIVVLGSVEAEQQITHLGQAEAPGCIARPEEFWRRVLLA